MGSRWVFRIKQNSDSSLERYKARLVAKGFHQKHGEDYDLTYSPVVKAANIRTILAISTSRQWKLHHLDICNAFLNGNLAETVYMEQPLGFTMKSTTARSHVCRLRKAIYGLKQAPRAWYQRLREFLHTCDFFNSTTDSSLFIKRNQKGIIYVLIYVDDFVITGDCETNVRKFINTVCTQFRCRDLGELSYFLGLEMNNTKITQRKYSMDLLNRFKMTEAKPNITTPSAPGSYLAANSGTPLTDPTSYRSLVGALQYLSFTRPDISFEVNQVCKFMQVPTTTHWQAAKRILRYIKGTIEFGLVFAKSPSTDLNILVDSDWATASPNRCRRRILGKTKQIKGLNVKSHQNSIYK